ncbi:MAG: trypsin-like serine protease [Phycisphaerales bacterium]|nr:trypsin-like serine protease [Phycisphaerales bacterium]
MRDYAQQRLDPKVLGYWYDTSAIFNGDQVLLELRVAPGDAGVFVRVDQLWLDCDCAPKFATQNFFPESLCGPDNRVASGDDRVGRISGCTAWLVSNGAVLTAGHCTPLGGVFEVNVPQSTASGGQVASATEDQFPINTTGIQFVNGGSGNDYCVFRLNPNGTTGERPHVQHGFFRMSRETPAAAATIRITGFGVDNTPAGPVANCCARDSNGNCTHFNCNSSSRTLQTSTGGYVSESGSGSDISHNYQTDTEPANSGSPIIWESTGFAIGIHTHGGCTSGGGGSNSGTSFEHNGLETALQSFPGANTRYLDLATYPNAPSPDGTVFQPFHNLAAAAASVPSGGQISIVEGSYLRSVAGNVTTLGADGKAIMLIAPVGTVTIGN